MRVAVLGAGKIGKVIYLRLIGEGIEAVNYDYPELDANNRDSVISAISGFDIVISALPYFLNKNVASACFVKEIAYFDLTEDVEVTKYIKGLSATNESKSIFMPQCGLAPGAINVIASDLARKLTRIDRLELRVGALPLVVSNEMKYYLSWSTNGLVNEYLNTGEALYNGKIVETLPFDGYETINLDGACYEAFNTSGGIGTLFETYKDNANIINYKTLRYPGHMSKMKFLFEDLRLSENRALVEQLFDNAVPTIVDGNDVVVLYCRAEGTNSIGKRVVYSFVDRVYGGDEYSAIQKTTAQGVINMVLLYIRNRELFPEGGFVKQEQFTWAEFTKYDTAVYANNKNWSL